MVCRITSWALLAGCVVIVAAGPATKPEFNSGAHPWPPTTLPAEKKAVVHAGMTLGDLVDKLGPGSWPPAEGVGILHWQFDDGKALLVLPRTFKADETLWPEKDPGENDDHKADAHFWWPADDYAALKLRPTSRSATGPATRKVK